RTKTDCDRMRDAAREMPHHASLLETRRTAEHAIKSDWHDRRIYILHDALETALELQQLPDARDLAFGKDTDHFAIADGIAGRLQRVNQFARALVRRNWNRMQDFGEWLDPFVLVNALVHQEPNGPVGRSSHQQGIGKGQVIAHQEHPTLRRKI